VCGGGVLGILEGRVFLGEGSRGLSGSIELPDGYHGVDRSYMAQLSQDESGSVPGHDIP
jgi:hypothetical protein